MKSTLSHDQTSSKDSINIRVEFDPREIEVRNGRDGLEIEIGDSVTEGRVGGPGLPAREVRVMLPVGTRPTTVSAVSRAAVKLAKRGATIAPVQPLADASVDRQSFERRASLAASRVRPHAAPDKALYEKERKSPRPIARLASWELFGSVPVAIIVVSPVTVNAESAVHFHTKLEIAVRYELASAEPKAAVHLRRPAVVRNYSDSARAARILSLLPDVVINRDTVRPEGGQPQGGRYLIITDDFTWNAATLEPVSPVAGLIDEFRRLKEWKERRGLSVTLKTVTQIVEDGYGTDARDLQEAIRRYIKCAHMHLGVSWVLLGGAKPIIPVRCVGAVTNNIDEVIPTDLYYSSLTVLNEVPPAHDWDPANTGSYAADATGANTAGVNFHADVSVGRVPARTAEEAKAWVTKLIAYEQFRNPNGSMLRRDWTNQALLVADSWWEWIAPSEATEPLPPWSFVRRPTNVLINAQVADEPDFLWPTTLRIWGRTGTADTRAVRIDYNRDASAQAAGYFFATSDTDLTPSEDAGVPIPTKWILIRGGSDVLQATAFCFDKSEYLDRSAGDQDLLAAQLVADLPDVQVSKLYEDHVAMQADGSETTVPFLGWGPVLPDRLRDPIPHFLSISGHGTQRGLNNTFRAHVIQNANNGHHSWITYVYSCNTARFDLDPDPAARPDPILPSIGELAVIKREGGAVAYVGASRWVKVKYPRYVREPFFHALADPATRHLGQLSDMRLLRLQTINIDEEDPGVSLVFMMNLLGDPEMPVWVGSPQTMVVTLPRAAVLRQPYNVVVRELTSSRLAGGLITRLVADATVTLRQLNATTGRWKVVAKGRSDQNGSAEMSLEKATRGPIEVTVSKRGFIPFLGEGMVVGSV